MSRTWGLCNSENLLNLSQETGYIKSIRWVWKKQWEGWPWPWFCHFHPHTVDVPAGAGHHGMRENSPACDTLQQFGLSDSWGLNFILLLLCIQFSQSVQIFTTVLTLLQKLKHQRPCWQLRIQMWGLFGAGRKVPKDRREHRAQHLSSAFFSPWSHAVFLAKGHIWSKSCWKNTSKLMAWRRHFWIWPQSPCPHCLTHGTFLPLRSTDLS